MTLTFKAFIYFKETTKLKADKRETLEKKVELEFIKGTGYEVKLAGGVPLKVKALGYILI